MMQLFKLLRYLKRKRIDRCLRKNENDPNGFALIKEQKVYRDIGFAIKNIPCPICKYAPTRKNHDPCIANLPGVKYACCGHGDRESSYITFKNGVVVRGFFIDDWELIGE